MRGAHVIARIALELGFDPRRLLTLRHFSRFLRDRAAFRAKGGSITHLFPVLQDYGSAAGNLDRHYFHQDLLVATLIQAANPMRHIDVGSRIDGFVAHVAAFRQIEVIDIRPLPDVGHDRIRFRQGDLTKWDNSLAEVCDSLSCLHALEHIGLGRYGDRIDPNGHRVAFANLCRMLQPGGRLYVSFPIGKRAVYFNAHRVFSPEEALAWAIDALRLERFDYVDDEGRLHQQALPTEVPPLVYGCGIYTFRKR